MNEGTTHREFGDELSFVHMAVGTTNTYLWMRRSVLENKRGAKRAYRSTQLEDVISRKQAAKRGHDAHL